MHSNYVRRRTGDLVHQPGVASRQPESRLNAQGSHREHHVRPSAPQSPSYDIRETSESAFSDERSIFNALVSSSAEEARSQESAPGNPIVDQGLAANMAMFIPGTCEAGSSSTECSCGVHGHRSQAIWWRTQMLSDQYSHRARQPGTGALGDGMDKANRDLLTHRKAISLGTEKENLQRPRRPVDLASAVKPVLPRYPPPVRAPTPPGLPSFGSPEAIHCSAQFLVRPNDANISSFMTGRGTPADSLRISSYGDALRRFFGLASSSPPADLPPALNVNGIGRAEDGTAVQGRFPYRHSAHGTGPARQLHDHPFHRGNVPLVDVVPADVGDDTDAEPRGLKDSVRGSRRQSQAPAIRFSRQRPPPAAASLPSVPEPAVTAPPKKSSKAASLLSLPRHLSQSYGLSQAPPHAETMQSLVNGVDPTCGCSIISPPQMQQHPPPPPVIPSSERNDEPHNIETPVSLLDPLTWLTAQLYLCCCIGLLDRQSTYTESLEPTSSRDTYATARSQRSTESQNGSASEDNNHHAPHVIQSWISSAYELVSHPRRRHRTARHVFV